MNLYLDTSVIVALLSNDPLTGHARDLLANAPDTIIVSELAAVEFASAIARRVRTQEITAENARAAFGLFDEWSDGPTGREHATAADGRSLGLPVLPA